MYLYVFFRSCPANNRKWYSLFSEQPFNFLHLFRHTLYNQPQFFRKKMLDRGPSTSYVNIKTTVPPKGHFKKRDDQAAIASVMPGENKLFGDALLHCNKPYFYQARVLHIRCSITYLLKGLGKG